MKKKLLITGSNGFVGKQVMNCLDNKKLDLILVIRENSKIDTAIKNKANKIFYSKDLFNESVEWWSDKCKDVDIVLHLAWYTEPSKYLNSEKNLDCLIGSYRLAMGARTAKIKKFVGIGTCAEYDFSEEKLSINTKLLPKTLYGSTKVALFHVLKNWFHEASIEFAWCRLFFLYGDGEHQDRLIPYLKRKLAAGEKVDLSDGNQIRDFLDVKVAGEIISKITLDNNVGQFNICSGIPKSVKDLVYEVAQKYSRPDLLNSGAREDKLTNFSKILGVPNFD